MHLWQCRIDIEASQQQTCRVPNQMHPTPTAVFGAFLDVGVSGRLNRIRQRVSGSLTEILVHKIRIAAEYECEISSYLFYDNTSSGVSRSYFSASAPDRFLISIARIRAENDCTIGDITITSNFVT